MFAKVAFAGALLCIAISGLPEPCWAQSPYFFSVTPPCTDAQTNSVSGYVSCSVTGYCTDMSKQSLQAFVAWSCAPAPWTSSAATWANQSGCNAYSAIWAEATTGPGWTTAYDVNAMCFCDLGCQIDQGWNVSNCNSGSIGE